MRVEVRAGLLQVSRIAHHHAFMSDILNTAIIGLGKSSFEPSIENYYQG